MPPFFGSKEELMRRVVRDQPDASKIPRRPIGYDEDANFLGEGLVQTAGPEVIVNKFLKYEEDYALLPTRQENPRSEIRTFYFKRFEHAKNCLNLYFDKDAQITEENVIGFVENVKFPYIEKEDLPNGERLGARLTWHESGMRERIALVRALIALTGKSVASVVPGAKRSREDGTEIPWDEVLESKMESLLQYAISGAERSSLAVLDWAEELLHDFATASTYIGQVTTPPETRLIRLDKNFAEIKNDSETDFKTKDEKLNWFQDQLDQQRHDQGYHTVEIYEKATKLYYRAPTLSLLGIIEGYFMCLGYDLSQRLQEPTMSRSSKLMQASSAAQSSRPVQASSTAPFRGDQSSEAITAIASFWKDQLAPWENRPARYPGIGDGDSDSPSVRSSKTLGSTAYLRQIPHRPNHYNEIRRRICGPAQKRTAWARKNRWNGPLKVPAIPEGHEKYSLFLLGTSQNIEDREKMSEKFRTDLKNDFEKDIEDPEMYVTCQEINEQYIKGNFVARSINCVSFPDCDFLSTYLYEALIIICVFAGQKMRVKPKSNSANAASKQTIVPKRTLVPKPIIGPDANLRIDRFAKNVLARSRQPRSTPTGKNAETILQRFRDLEESMNTADEHKKPEKEIPEILIPARTDVRVGLTSTFNSCKEYFKYGKLKPGDEEKLVEAELVEKVLQYLNLCNYYLALNARWWASPASKSWTVEREKAWEEKQTGLRERDVKENPYKDDEVEGGSGADGAGGAGGAGGFSFAPMQYIFYSDPTGGEV